MGAETAGTNKIQDDPKLLAVLVDGFSKGYTDAEACFAAGISKFVLYAYIDMFPEFGERKEELKRNPILTAKTRVVSQLKDDTSTSKWYLERTTKQFRPPDKQLGNTSNTLILLTEAQLQDRLAHKLGKLLSLGTGDDVMDGEVVDDMLNTGHED